MTTVYYHKAEGLGLVFVEWTKESPFDSFFPAIRGGVVIALDRCVCRIEDWESTLFGVGFMFNRIGMPAWAEAMRPIWCRLLPPQTVINYDAVELFTSLCGNEMVVGKVIK